MNNKTTTVTLVTVATRLHRTRVFHNH